MEGGWYEKPGGPGSYPDLTLNCPVNLGKVFILSAPQFLHL